MKLEQQVASLELAKKLKHLGVEQKSLFWWFRVHSDIWKLGTMAEMMNTAVDVGQSTTPQFDDCGAFTVAELGELLPAFNPDASPFQQLHIRKNRNANGSEWSVVYCNQRLGTFSQFVFFADTEADARAKMLIYLIENGFIETEGGREPPDE